MKLQYQLPAIVFLAYACASAGPRSPFDRDPASCQALGAADPQLGDTAVYDTLQLTTQPYRLYFPPPNYRRQMLVERRPGAIDMAIVIEKDGRVQPNSIEVLSVSDPAFVDPSTAVMRRARFCPGTVDGRAVRARLRIPLRY